MTDSEPVGSGSESGPVDEFAPDPRNVRLLKWAIYIMSALLVIGTIVVAVTIANRASKLGGSGTTGFDTLNVAVESGATVADIDVDGDRMAVHLVKGEDDAGEILVINVRRGLLEGRIKLAPQN